MPHKIAGIDVHKKMLAVVVGDASESEIKVLQKRKFGAMPADLQLLSEWLAALDVQEVVMESTAQYWKPVWQALEDDFHLELAQALSNRGARGRKNDFRDAERLVRRYVADELTLSFVPDSKQRFWRTLSRTRQRYCREKCRLQNQLEALLEEMRIKLSSQLSDPLGVSGQRMLHAIADGESNPEAIANLADPNVRATREQLMDACKEVRKLSPGYRRVLKMFLERLALIEMHGEKLEESLAEELREHQDSVQGLAEIPGLGINSAQQIIAEVGPTAERFPHGANLCSWVGTCPGEEVSAEQAGSTASPKGNAPMRRVLSEAANAAIKMKDTVFEARYWRIRGRDPKRHNEAVWAVANHLCRVIWKLLHAKVVYQEFGNRRNPRADRRRTNRLLRELRALGYTVTAAPKIKHMPV